ncbi:hypothetical protein E4T56_gene17692, partial [Termitomyces sp. T112]
ELILDLAGGDQEATEPHRIAGARFVDERPVGPQPPDIAGAEEAPRKREGALISISPETPLGTSSPVSTSRMRTLASGDIGQPPPDAVGEGIARPRDRKQRLHLAGAVETEQRQAARLGLGRQFAPAGLERGEAAEFEMRERPWRIGEREDTAKHLVGAEGVSDFPRRENSAGRLGLEGIQHMDPCTGRDETEEAGQAERAAERQDRQQRMAFGRKRQRRGD